MIRINLLPVREERRKAGARQLALVLALTLLGSVLLSGAFHWKVRHDIAWTRELAQATQKDIENFGPQLKQVEEFKKTKADIEQKLGVIESLYEARSGPVHVLDELSTHTPDRIWISKVSIRGGKLTLEGMSLDNELVALFLRSLGDSSTFDKVDLDSTKVGDAKNGLRLVAFSIQASLGAKAAAEPAQPKAG